MQAPASYSKVIDRKYPEQVAIAIARDPQGKYNPITLGWVMPTSHAPPMLAISIGLTRYSLEAVRHAGSFVVSLPSTDMAEDAMFYGTKSGRDMDKIAEFGTKTQPATQIDSVLLAEAVANFECKLVGELQTGDHVIFAGEVVACCQNEDSSVRRVYTVAPGFVMNGVVPG